MLHSVAAHSKATEQLAQRPGRVVRRTTCAKVLLEFGKESGSQMIAKVGVYRSCQVGAPTAR